MDHIDGPVQGSRAELTGPQFGSKTVVFDEEEIIASVMGLSIKSRVGVAGETDIPVRIDTDTACIIGSGGAQLLGPFTFSVFLLSSASFQRTPVTSARWGGAAAVPPGVPAETEHSTAEHTSR